MRVVLLVLALVLAPLRAVAQSDEVDALLRAGVQLRREHRDEEALATFQRAWQRSRSPQALAQIGFAEQALGRWLDADAHLREARAATAHPWIATHLDVIDAALVVVGRHLGQLELRGGVPGAQVLVNGQRAGELPFRTPLRVVAGSLTLEVRAAGHRPFVRDLVVAAGALAREEVTLVRDAAAPRAVVPPAPPGAPTPRVAAEGGSALPALRWVAAGGAAVGLLGGAVALVVRNDAATAWNDPVCLRDERTREQNCQDLRDRGATAEALAVAGFVAGGVLAVTSAVLFLATPAPSRERATARWGCGVGPGAMGVACVGEF